MDNDTVERELRALVDSPDNPCFVCGPENPVGLHLRFEQSGGRVRAEFEPLPHHQGWQGVIHGGLLAAVLDEAMAYTLFLSGEVGVTARMDLRYRRPARAGDHLRIEARLLRSGRKIADIEAQILRGSEMLVEAAARFVKLGPISAETLRGRFDGAT